MDFEMYTNRADNIDSSPVNRHINRFCDSKIRRSRRHHVYQLYVPTTKGFGEVFHRANVTSRIHRKSEFEVIENLTQVFALSSSAAGSGKVIR